MSDVEGEFRCTRGVLLTLIIFVHNFSSSTMVLQFTLELCDISFDKVNRPLTLSGHHNGKNTVCQTQLWLGGLREIVFCSL